MWLEVVFSLQPWVAPVFHGNRRVEILLAWALNSHLQKSKVLPFWCGCDARLAEIAEMGSTI